MPSTWSSRTQVLVTVDSGADFTHLPAQFADRLGVELGHLKKEYTGTVEKGRRVAVYEKVPLLAYLCDEWIDLPVKFFVEDIGTAVLGRAGAFEELQIAFLEREKVIYASRRSPLNR